MASHPSASYKFAIQYSRLKPQPQIKNDGEDAVMMRTEARKLTMFSTRNMKPLSTIEDLDLIMAKLGFYSAVVHTTPPASAADLGENTFLGWREYVFNSKWTRVKSLDDTPPRALIPYPRIDGLHESIYAEFVKAVEFYLRWHDVTEIFHVRGVPLDRVKDRGKEWQSMQEGEILVFVYREVPMLDLKIQEVKKIGKVNGVDRPAMRQGDDGCEVGRFVDFSNIVTKTSKR
ncbi:unnamed protein product [Rhodiola kirilowii]